MARDLFFLLSGFEEVCALLHCVAGGATEHQLSCRDIDVFCAKARAESDLSHDIVGCAVAPPCLMLLRFRQFGPHNALDFGERHWHLGFALGSQVVPKATIFAQMTLISSISLIKGNRGNAVKNPDIHDASCSV